MDTVIFLGRVHPAGFTVNVSAPQITYTADDGTLSGEMNVSVVNSNVAVTWRVDGFSRDNLFPLYRHAERVTKGMVDLIAFKHGAAAIVILDSWIDPAGKWDKISLVEPAVQGLATALPSDSNLLRVFSLIAEQQELLLVLEDLIATLASQDHKTINCARCVEAVRQLIAGYGLKREDQWPVMREKLNLDRSYIALIMAHSLDQRHGKQVEIDPRIVTEIMKRTWTIIDRYFHYRLGGDEMLSSDRFPTLSD